MAIDFRNNIGIALAIRAIFQVDDVANVDKRFASLARVTCILVGTLLRGDRVFGDGGTGADEQC